MSLTSCCLITQDSDTARSEAKVLAEGITDPADSSDDAESSRRWLAKAAFSAVVNISAAIRDGKEMEYKRKARSQLCRIGEKIATLVELKKKKDEAKPLAATYPSALAPLNAAMKEQISNITSSMININMYYANARFYKCLNKVSQHR